MRVSFRADAHGGVRILRSCNGREFPRKLYADFFANNLIVGLSKKYAAAICKPLRLLH